MNAMIVEKVRLMISTGERTMMYALATSERIPESLCTSLTYEAHLTPWTQDRSSVEALQTRYRAE